MFSTFMEKIYNKNLEIENNQDEFVLTPHSRINVS